MNSLVVTSVYEPEKKDYIRVLANYKGKIVSLFWLNLGKDGSIYISPSKKEIKSVRTGKTTAENGTISINYNEGESIEDLKQLNSKTSFHASGAINSIDSSRSYRSSLRNIQEQEELCIFLFQHPEKMEEIKKIKKRDVGINFSITDENLLVAYVHVSPLKKVQTLIYDGFKEQSNIILEFKDLDNCQDLAIQINVLSFKEGNEWPPFTYMIYPTKEDNDSRDDFG